MLLLKFVSMVIFFENSFKNCLSWEDHLDLAWYHNISTAQQAWYDFIFFEESTVTNSAVWLVLYAVRIFLYLPTEMVRLTRVFVFLFIVFLKPFKSKSFLSKQLFIRQEIWKTKALFSKQIFITIFKSRNPSSQRRLVLLHLQSGACLCEWRRRN